MTRSEGSMSDLRAAAERVVELWNAKPTNYRPAQFGDAMEQLEAALAAEQPQPSAPSGWIACDERMPEAGVEVLVWLAAPAFKGSSNVVMDTWDEQHEAPVAWSSATIPVGMGWDSGTDWERITHWMPLPAAPGVAPPPAAPQAEAPSQFARGIDAAARFVEKRLADYDAEHGSTDPDTGTREYPGTGDEYACELAEIAEAIRALAPPPSAPQPEAHPVAWMVYTQDGQSVYVTDNPADIKPGQRALPLYTSPQPINKGE